MTAAVECAGVTVDYGATRAVDGVDIRLEAGETLALLGPSGSGKTTLVYAIAGFVPLAGGEIAIQGRTVASLGRTVPPENRKVGMVFQNYALWPHLNALDTVAYPLRRQGLSRADARSRAAELLERLGMADLAHRRPAELSGGQQQRVGLARALARDAAVYLFDEPTAHLDGAVRAAVQEEIARARRDAGAAAIYASHDAEEALALADRVALLREGRLVQVGTPREVYEEPVDVWAARLTGPAAVLDRDGTPMMVRPEWVRLGGPIPGEVVEVWYRGPHTDYRVETRAGPVLARTPGPPAATPGDRPGMTIERSWELPASPSTT